MKLIQFSSERGLLSCKSLSKISLSEATIEIGLVQSCKVNKPPLQSAKLLSLNIFALSVRVVTRNI